MPRHPARAFSRGIPIPHRAFLPNRFPPAGRTSYAKETAMTLGPVEYVLIGFPGNRFKGEIIPALAQLGGVRRAEGQDPRRVMTQHVEVR
jgi:hypothetical protein